MTTLGKNVKITAPDSARSQTRTMFAAIGATLVTPNDHMDVFALTGGSNIGFAYVPAAEALTAEQMRRAPWLELEVADVETTRARLDALGLQRIEYADQAHPYFAGPGGFVFRLASSS